MQQSLIRSSKSREQHHKAEFGQVLSRKV